MKTISLGDIHGRDVWKFILFGSCYEYNTWRTAVEAGAPIDWDGDMPFLQHDKIIFVGDYVDSFDVSSAVILHNLKEIVDLKQKLGDRVVLLLGNHDVQYFVKGQMCSGHRPELQHDLEKLFLENADGFQLAYQYGDHLWTHAGVSSRWLSEMRSELFNPGFRFADLVRDDNPQTLADELNLAWQFQLPSLFNCDMDSGGYQMYAGPMWIRPKRLDANPLEGISQVVGHTTKSHIIKGVVGDVVHWYIDCLEFGDENALKLEL